MLDIWLLFWVMVYDVSKKKENLNPKNQQQTFAQHTRALHKGLLICTNLRPRKQLLLEHLAHAFFRCVSYIADAACSRSVRVRFEHRDSTAVEPAEGRPPVGHSLRLAQSPPAAAVPHDSPELPGTTSCQAVDAVLQVQYLFFAVNGNIRLGCPLSIRNYFSYAKSVSKAEWKVNAGQDE